MVKHSSDLVVVNFTAEWYLPCKYITRDLKECSTSFPEVTFIKSDVDANFEIKEHFNIDVVPHIKFFRKTDDGLSEVESYVGSDIFKVRSILEKLNE